MKKVMGIAIIAAVVLMASCKKDDYIIGGSLHNSKTDLSTLDYLRKNPLFDTLCLLVDKAGVQNKINESGASFFAPTDYHIATYIATKRAAVQRLDAEKTYTVDSLIKYDLAAFRDSIDVHIVKKALPYSVLKEERVTYPTAFAGVSAYISYREVKEEALGYNPNTGVFPRLVYYRIGTMETYCQTSGLTTSTGMLFVLQNPGGYSSGSPTLYFRK